jgi:hypothetical protein
MTKKSGGLLIGVAELMAAERIDRLIEKERRQIEKNAKKHPGSAPNTSERLRALIDARELFVKEWNPNE